MHQKTIRYVVKAYFYQINFTEQTQKGINLWFNNEIKKNFCYQSCSEILIHGYFLLPALKAIYVRDRDLLCPNLKAIKK